MDQQQQRELIQTEAEELSKKYRHLLITWATGCGKGKAVMRCIAASTSSKKWLIVVPEIFQIENYKKDLEKHGFSYLLGTKILDIICYASFSKYQGQDLNLALNEVHYMSDARLEIASTIKFDQIVSDSATIPSHVRKGLRNLAPFHEYHISLNEAIDEGILPSPKVNIVAVELDKFHKNIPVKKSFGKKVVNMKMTEHNYAKMLDIDVKYWENRSKEENWPVWIQRKLQQMYLHRKKFLAECKTKKVKELLEQLKGKRIICFAGSIDQADQLSKESSVHSKKSAKTNKLTLAMFENREMNLIVTNKMMREGMNLDGLDAGIIVQLNSGKDDEGLSFLQMTGRTMRAVAPIVYIFYAKGTNDEKYLRNALTNIDKKYVIYGYETKID